MCFCGWLLRLITKKLSSQCGENKQHNKQRRKTASWLSATQSKRQSNIIFVFIANLLGYAWSIGSGDHFAVWLSRCCRPVVIQYRKKEGIQTRPESRPKKIRQPQN